MSIIWMNILGKYIYKHTYIYIAKKMTVMMTCVYCSKLEIKMCVCVCLKTMTT